AFIGGQHARADAAVVGQLVIVGQLFACTDGSPRLDEDASFIVLVGVAVGIARVVDPACRVAAYVGIDHAAVRKLENERVVRIVRIAVGARLRNLPGRALAAVFEDRGSLAYRARREHAAPVNAGIADRVGAARRGGNGHAGRRVGGDGN